MKTTVLAALISALAVPALANPGADMFARTLGLEPGEYSVSEMLAIQEARRENDASAERFYLSRGKSDVVNFAEVASPGAAQFALTLGLQPGEYTVAEMMAIREARRENDAAAERFYLSKGNRAPANPAETVTPGEAQIAARLGLDPAQHTLSDLVRIEVQADSSSSD